MQDIICETIQLKRLNTVYIRDGGRGGARGLENPGVRLGKIFFTLYLYFIFLTFICIYVVSPCQIYINKISP